MGDNILIAYHNKSVFGLKIQATKQNCPAKLIRKKIEKFIQLPVHYAPQQPFL